MSSAGWFQWLYTDYYEEASLWVGSLDGRSFEVLESAPDMQGVGSFVPGNGALLASSVRSDAGSIDLVDTATGVRSNVAKFPGYTVGTFDATAAYVYWIAWDANAPTGLWRRSTSLKPAEKIMDGPDVLPGDIAFSSDSKYVAISGCRCGPGTMEANFDYAVFDASFKLISELKNTSHGGVLGFLDDRLVVYPHFTDDGPLGPLAVLDIRDWSSQEVASSAGFERAAILSDLDGEPRLVFDGHDENDRYTVSVLDPNGAVRLLFVSEAGVRYDEAPETLVLGSGGINAPGWVAVFPRGDAMIAAALSGGDQGVRRLIRISDGAVVLVPPLSVQP